jgi:hypothetical protein
MKYERVFFTLRPNGMFFHKNELPGIRKDGLNLDIVFFCKDVVESVEAWFARKEGAAAWMGPKPRAWPRSSNMSRPQSTG